MAMSERRRFRSPLAAAAPPSAPDSNRARILIQWREAVAQTVEIRQRPFEIIAITFNARTQDYFVSQPGRGLA